MKRFLIILVLIFIPFAVSTAENAPILTRDTLTAQFGLEDTGFLDDFISEYLPTEEYLETVNIERVYNNYVRRRYLEQNDYLWLLEAIKNTNETVFTSDNISKILWFWNANAMIEARLFDIADMKVYSKDSNFLPNIQQADIHTIGQSEIDELINQLVDYGVGEWDEYYLSTANDTTGHLYWRFAIEFKDGTYFVSFGSGSTADNLPVNYSQVMDLLQVEYE